MEATTYGYARVSAKDQCEERQLIALREFPVAEANIFLDKVSGKDFNRPAYRRLIRRLRPRDLLVIKSIDRLGRNYEETWNSGSILPRKGRPTSSFWICLFWIPGRRGKISLELSWRIWCCRSSLTWPRQNGKTYASGKRRASPPPGSGAYSSGVRANRFQKLFVI